MKCVYCLENKAPSSEHIFPDFFYEKLNLKNNDSKFFTYETYTNQSKVRELQIADVCEECNTHKLSNLDRHVSKVIDTLLSSNNEKVTIFYDYDLLQRWLLKTVFNTTRLIRADSTSKIYSNYYLKYMLNGEKNTLIPETLLFGFKMKSTSFSSSFTSIGTLVPFQNTFAEYLNIFDFFQIKNFVFIVVSFKNSKYFKEYSPRVIDYLQKIYGATLIPECGEFIFDDSTCHLQNIYLFNANETSSNIPLRLLCRLQWNLHESSPFMLQQINSDSIHTSNKVRYLIRSLMEIIYQKDKHFLISTQDGPIFIMSETEKLLKHPCNVSDNSFQNKENIQECTQAFVNITRYRDLTLIEIHDKNDLKNPFVTNRTNQSSGKWNIFINSIKQSNDFLYFAFTRHPNIQQQIENSYLNNLNIVSKIKIKKIKMA